MINSNQGWPLRDEIKEAIAREYDWPHPGSEITTEPLPRAVEGTYQTEQGIVCEVTCEGAELRISIIPPIVATPECVSLAIAYPTKPSERPFQSRRELWLQHFGSQSSRNPQG